MRRNKTQEKITPKCEPSNNSNMHAWNYSNSQTILTMAAAAATMYHPPHAYIHADALAHIIVPTRETNEEKSKTSRKLHVAACDRDDGRMLDASSVRCCPPCLPGAPHCCRQHILHEIHSFAWAHAVRSGRSHIECLYTPQPASTQSACVHIHMVHMHEYMYNIYTQYIIYLLSVYNQLGWSFFFDRFFAVPLLLPLLVYRLELARAQNNSPRRQLRMDVWPRRCSIKTVC